MQCYEWGPEFATNRYSRMNTFNTTKQPSLLELKSFIALVPVFPPEVGFFISFFDFIKLFCRWIDKLECLDSDRHFLPKDLS